MFTLNFYEQKKALTSICGSIIFKVFDDLGEYLRKAWRIAFICMEGLKNMRNNIGFVYLRSHERSKFSRVAFPGFTDRRASGSNGL